MMCIPVTGFSQIASSLSLTASPNPATYGRVVTLQATVTAGATGKVTFYDGTTVLGIAPISSNQAMLVTKLLAAGNRSLRAYYGGDNTYAASSSTIVSEVVTAAVSLGFKAAANYPAVNATGTCVAIGDFNGDGVADLATANGTTIDILLGNGDGTFRTAVPYNAAGSARCLAAGDFNGDGITDLAVTSQGATYVAILLGNGDGTFRAPVNYTVGNNPVGVAAGDFNHDGIVDLAVLNQSSSSISILLGRGDGTFRSAVNYSSIASEQYLALGDVNNDGTPDLIASGGGGLFLLLGNGDGTFSAAATLSTASTGALAVADVNNDGNADLLVGSYSAANVEVFLGNGNGTFQSPVNYSAYSYISGVVAGDFNGDGKIDLAVTSQYYYTADLFIFFGNGDGTFQTPVTYGVGQNFVGLAGGEFNGDGIADLVGISSSGASVLLGGALPDLSIAVGHGNGFTQGQVGAFYTITVTNVGAIATSGGVGVVFSLPFGFTATAISGSGWFCGLNTLTCTRSDLLAINSSYPSITVTVNVPAALTGNVTATATVSGGGDQNAANNSGSDVAFVRYLAPLSLTVSPNPAQLGQAVTLHAAITPGATGSVTFFDGVSTLGGSPLSAGQASLTTYALQGGAHALRAVYSGDGTYGPTGSNVVSETITQVGDNGLQTPISSSVPGLSQTIGTADFNRDGHLDVVGTSGGNISLLLGNGDGTFVGPYVYTAPTTSSLSSLVVGDFNGDGKPDVVVSDSTNLYVLLGNGDGSFQTPIKIALTNAYLTNLVVADFDGNGWLDLAVLNSGVPTIFFGNGNGTFQSPMPIANAGTGWGGLRVADINGDGKADLIGLNTSFYGYVIVMLGNGDGTFQTPVNYSDPSLTYPDSFVVGDFNGDGKQDVAVIYWVGVTVLIGNGDGTLGTVKKTSLNGVPGYQVIAGDFNGDGKLDIAYSAYATGGLYLAFGNGDGTFQPGAELLPNGSPAGFVAGDFNGDGKIDLAVSNPSYNNASLNIFLGNQYSGLGIALTHNGNFIGGTSGTYQVQISNPTFLPTTGAINVTIALPTGLTATALSGVNWTCTLATLTCTRSDAQAAIGSATAITLTVSVSAGIAPSVVRPSATVSNGGMQNSSTNPTNIVVSTTTSLAVSPSSSGLGQAVTLTATVIAGTSGTVEFFDGGMFLGSAVVSGTQARLVTHLLPAGVRSLKATYSGDTTHGASSSGLIAETVTAGQTSGLSVATSYSTGLGPAAIVSGDFNGDGFTDLAIANSSGGTVSVLLGVGDGTFRPKVDYTVGTEPFGLAVGDFNSDGKPDLAVVNETSDSVSILIGNGDGTFQPAASIALTVSPNSIAVGDVNGDGKADLVVGSASGAQILFGNGDGTFYSGTLTGNYSTNVGLGYFNNDAITDIVTLGVYVQLGNGDGTFQNPTYWGGGSGTSFALGDMNGDGKLDVVFPSYSGMTVDLGKGDGTYVSSTNTVFSTSPLGITVADVNGDGKLDVIAANSGLNSISVFLGNGDGSLQAPISYTAGTSTSQALAVLAGDFNGDGRTDIAVLNSQTNSVSILTGILTPVLSISSSHNGSFAPGQSGATYQIVVSSNGPGTTSGTVTVTDALPTGLTATGLSGLNWNCTLATLTCMRSDALVTSASYPAITLTVSVSSSAPSTVTNMVTVSGGSAIGAVSSDFTVITATPPVFSISKSHVGSFAAGETGAVYSITVSNGATGGPSVGAVTVTDNVPAGLTLVGMSGTGWVCSGNICGRSDALAGNSSYPTISVYVDVASNAVSPVVNSATITGGGSVNASASDSTVITPPGPPLNVSVAPNAGAGSSQVFTATYWDALGYQDIMQAFFMVASNTTGVAGCFAMAQGNYFYLGNDAANAWLGPVQAGSSSSVQNSSCTLSGANSSNTGTGNSLVVRFGLTFAAGFTGPRNLYEMVFGKAGSTAWQPQGTWTAYPFAPPLNGSVVPATGSGPSQVFTATYIDQQGYQDITQALFMVASNTTGARACSARWVPAGNLFYLGNDAGTGWLGPVQGGTSATVQNSQCTLNAATSSASGSGNQLTVQFALSFANAFFGARNTYEMVSGSGGSSSWQQEGTWTAGAPLPPTNISVMPSSGNGASQIFAAAYSDPQGYQDISAALFMVANDATGVSGCFVMWTPGNYLYLGNDAGTAWLGPIAMGANSTLQNSQCTLNGSTSGAIHNGTSLTVNFSLSFAVGFTGIKNTYEMAIAPGGNTGWQKQGTWITGALQMPTNVSVSPSVGSGTSQVFFANYSDAQGYQDISRALFMVSADTTGVSGCFAMWVQAGNLLYLGNDAANVWLGPIQAGTSSTLQNSQCTLNASTSTANGSGNSLTMHFGLAFSGTFTGAKNTYQMVFGGAGNTAWQQMGTWSPAAAQPPLNGSVLPNNGSGTSQVFAAAYTDAQGYQDISMALFMVASDSTGVGGCFVMWTPGNYLYLGNDAATAWLGPIHAGTGTLQNSQCTLNGSVSSGSGSGNSLSVNFGLTFSFTGTRNLYQLVYGSGGNTGWQQVGTWTPAPGSVPVNFSISPASGSGSSQAFTATYNDSQGSQDIGRALFMISNNTSGVGACFVMWTTGNYLYLGNDAGTAWLGPIQVGASTTVQNSQCTLSGATSSVAHSGNTLVVNFGLSFAAGFNTPQNTYMMAFGSGGNTGWQQMGAWTP